MAGRDRRRSSAASLELSAASRVDWVMAGKPASLTAALKTRFVGPVNARIGAGASGSRGCWVNVYTMRTCTLQTAVAAVRIALE